MKIKTCDICGKEGKLWKAKTKNQLGQCKSCANKPKVGEVYREGKVSYDEIGVPYNKEFRVISITPSNKAVGEVKKKRKKNISPIAEKEKKRLAEYRIVRDEWLGINNRCQFPNCYSKDVQLHHGAGRIGTLLTDTRYFVALCDTHHRWTELHPLEAKEMGLSFNRLDK